MSFGNADGSMPLSAGDMSLPLSAGDMSMPLSADDQSMPMFADFSMPMDADMSLPMDADFSMPVDEAMMSLDFALSMASPADADVTVCDDESNARSTVLVDLEITIPEGAVVDALKGGIGSFTMLCPIQSRMLWEMEREMYESSILGVEVKGVTPDTNATCSDEDADDCTVATAKFEVIHKQNNAEAARAEFLLNLTTTIEGIDGVSVKAGNPSSPESSEIPAEATVLETSGKALGNGVIVVAAIGSVAIVAVALVLVQRKMSKKRSDDKSLDGSASTSQNSTAYDTSLPIF